MSWAEVPTERGFPVIGPLGLELKDVEQSTTE
jgi:hypothetical protein